jgi:hypothetical protein
MRLVWGLVWEPVGDRYDAQEILDAGRLRLWRLSVNPLR